MAQRAEEGGVEGRDWGWGGALLRRRAASRRRPVPPSPPGAAASTATLHPSPWQYGHTALDLAEVGNTEVVELLENAPAMAAQVGAAPLSPLCTPASIERRATDC